MKVILKATFWPASGWRLLALVVAVTTTKGLLSALYREKKLDNILVSANSAIKGMDLRMLTMCLAISRIEGNRLSYTSVGMPALLLFRAGSGRCEQRVLKAMPLGAVQSFPYKSLSTSLHVGDVVVMLSDGLIETFDESGETYGIENLPALKVTHTEVLTRLSRRFEDGNSWGNNSPLVDDITIVAVRVTDKKGTES